MEIPTTEPKPWAHITKELLVRQLKNLLVEDIKDFSIKIDENSFYYEIEISLTLVKPEDQ